MTRQLASLRNIAMALLTSTVIYVVAAFLILPQQEVPPEDMQTMLLALGMAALMTSSVLPLVRYKLLGGFALTGPNEMAVSRADPTDAASVRELLPKALRKYFTGSIVCLAVSEAVVIDGFVAAYLVDDPKVILPFFVYGFLLMLAQFPRQATFLSMLEAGAVKTIRAGGLD